MPTADINRLKGIAELHREYPESFTIVYFFAEALEGYYCSLWDGLERNSGHVIYRLSDFIPKDKRENMPVYPSLTGSIVDKGLVQWDSLEDWRNRWEKASNNDIPYFQNQLPSVLRELFSNQE